MFSCNLEWNRKHEQYGVEVDNEKWGWRESTEQDVVTCQMESSNHPLFYEPIKVVLKLSQKRRVGESLGTRLVHW